MPANDIESDAAQWLIRLEGDSSRETRASFDAWLAADSRHQAAFVRLKETWTRVDILKRLRPLDGTIDEQVLERFGAPATVGGTPEAKSRRRMPLVALAASLFLIGAVSVVWFALKQWGWESYHTEFGGFQRVVLSDGSTAMLNTATRIRARMSSGRRQVILEKGEALFTVAHDVRRPFDVSAGNTVVRAVGTAFAVRLKDHKEVDLLVAQGRIAINPPEDAPADKLAGHAALPRISTLAAGETASIKAHRPMEVERIAADEVTRRLAWTQGRIWFDRVTLAAAVAELNRYNRRQLVIDDPSIAGLRIGGAFDITDLDSFIAALDTFGIHAMAETETAGDSGAQTIRLTRATAPH